MSAARAGARRRPPVPSARPGHSPVPGHRRSEPTEGSTKPILVVRKVSAVLDVFTGEQSGLALKDIADATGFPTSTCARILYTLVDQGILERRGDEYRIGLAVLRWAGAALRAFDLVGLLTPIIERLRDVTGETAAVYVRQGTTRTCVAVAASRESVIWQCRVGLTTPLHVGSGGRAILAFDEEALRAVRDPGYDWVRFTDETVTSIEDLDEALALVRATGVAVSHEELDSGVAGVSGAVFGSAGEVLCSIGVSGPAQRFTAGDVERYVPCVLDAVGEASKLMGGELPVGSTQEGRP